MTKKKTKQQYRIRNWREYNKALVGRGSLTLWFDVDAVGSWLNHEKSGGRGKPRVYADVCVLCLLTLKAVYQLPQRATQGLVTSLVRLLKLDLPVPHHTILAKRAARLEVSLPRQPRDRPLHVVVDATGLKVYGEGERAPIRCSTGWGPSGKFVSTGTRSAGRGANFTSGWTRPRGSS